MDICQNTMLDGYEAMRFAAALGLGYVKRFGLLPVMRAGSQDPYETTGAVIAVDHVVEQPPVI